MLLHIDTAVLRSAVSVAEQTNSSISDAASLLNQITVHEDWICKERDQIKQMTLANKQTAQDIENRAENFYKAIQNASQKFDEKEQEINTRINGVDDIIGQVINVVPGITGGSTGGALRMRLRSAARIPATAIFRSVTSKIYSVHWRDKRWQERILN
ncbi:MAG: hypothetical protein ACLTSZ_04755 [Lachnospiraceae bacterium]